MTWLLPKPKHLHASVLSRISHAFIWILLYTSNPSPWCPALAFPNNSFLFFQLLLPYLLVLVETWVYGNSTPLMVFWRCPQSQKQVETNILVLPWRHFFISTHLPILWSTRVSLDHLLLLFLAVNRRSWSVLYFPWRIWPKFTISSFTPLANLSLGNFINMRHNATYKVVWSHSPTQPLFTTRSQGTN